MQKLYLDTRINKIWDFQGITLNSMTFPAKAAIQGLFISVLTVQDVDHTRGFIIGDLPS